MSNKPLFILNAGVIDMDENKCRVLAKQRPADGAISIYFAAVICQLYDLMTSGKLKGVSPDQIRIVLTDG